MAAFWSDDQFLLCYARLVTTRIARATEFKAKHLALGDEIGEDGGTITVTKRGRPVAAVTPAR
jgi:hypothetical protein